MNRDWCEKALSRLEIIWPPWITPKGCFTPTSDFYSLLAKYDRLSSVITTMSEHVGLRADAIIDIVHDSDVTGLDFVTGRRFDHKEIDAAADVHSTSIIEMKIRIAARQLSSPRKLARLLAHESSHHFLKIANVHAETELEEEMFTDVAAIFLGFGKVMLNGAAEEPPEAINPPIHITDNDIPYLGYPLVAYSYFSWAKSKKLSTQQTLDQITGPCVQFLRSFEYYHANGRGCWARIKAYFRSMPPEPGCDGSTAFEQCRKHRSMEFNIISCRSCGTSLRVPRTEKTLLVTCPKCKGKFEVRFRQCREKLS